MTISTDKQIRKLTDKIKGKVVKEVTIPETKSRFDTKYDVNNDAGDIAIIFEDGSQLIAWNSEWGAVGYIPK